MLSATLLAIILVIMALITVIGFFAGGWWFLIGFLSGFLALGLSAAISPRVRDWFDWADDQIDDERLIDMVKERFNGKKVKAKDGTTIQVEVVQ